jgi:DNA polymerase III epsilon subunit family exonuclease
MFYRSLNPERAMPADAVAVHGPTAAFLAEKPLFGDVVEDFLVFVGDASLVAHNAGFDIAFINVELKRRPAVHEPVSASAIRTQCRRVRADHQLPRTTRHRDIEVLPVHEFGS